jgi:hypothetical protein
LALSHRLRHGIGLVDQLHHPPVLAQEFLGIEIDTRRPSDADAVQHGPLQLMQMAGVHLLVQPIN